MNRTSRKSRDNVRIELFIFLGGFLLVPDEPEVGGSFTAVIFAKKTFCVLLSPLIRHG